MICAVFLDRDGTLIEDRNYLAHPDGVVLLPGVVDGLKRLRDAGYLLVVVTNQSGIGRGYYTHDDYHAVAARMEHLLAEQDIELAATRYCPHGPEDGCTCRKPLPGMVFDAATALGIDLAYSAMIGDKARDVEAGIAAGCGRNILLDPANSAAFRAAVDQILSP